MIFSSETRMKNRGKMVKLRLADKMANTEWRNLFWPKMRKTKPMRRMLAKSWKIQAAQVVTMVSLLRLRRRLITSGSSIPVAAIRLVCFNNGGDRFIWFT